MRAFDPGARISRHFTFHEVLWLPSWNRIALPSDGLDDQVLDNLAGLCARVDQVLDRHGWHARVHCGYRPARYNAEVKGARASAHLADRPGVAALDFDPIDVNCESARRLLVASSQLEELGLRLEDNGPEGNWLHLDSAPIPLGGHRYFKP